VTARISFTPGTLTRCVFARANPALAGTRVFVQLADQLEPRYGCAVTLHWQERAFSELTIEELYAIIALREAVFVVEQRCPYLDADGLDPGSRHLWASSGDAIHAYCRIVPAGAKFAEISIGRVITAPIARGTGLGKELMRRAIEACGPEPIRIGAQAHLERFYGELGFVRASEPFDEDGILHVEMLRAR
jgi:ElaA protein